MTASQASMIGGSRLVSNLAGSIDSTSHPHGVLERWLRARHNDAQVVCRGVDGPANIRHSERARTNKRPRSGASPYFGSKERTRSDRKFCTCVGAPDRRSKTDQRPAAPRRIVEHGVSPRAGLLRGADVQKLERVGC